MPANDTPFIRLQRMEKHLREARATPEHGDFPDDAKWLLQELANLKGAAADRDRYKQELAQSNADLTRLQRIFHEMRNPKPASPAGPIKAPGEA